MISIVGGVYPEVCIYPEWNQIFGSGGRSAAALCELSNKVDLFCYISRHLLMDIKAISNSFGYNLHPVLNEKSVSFKYFHGLSRPEIYPHNYLHFNANTIIVKASNILRFGFIEGNAKVEGEWVVYDPQSATAPEGFHNNGSSAKHLSIVLNANEGRLLSGEYDPYKIVSKLLADSEAEVIILKMGPLGTLIHTEKHNKLLPCLKTNKVWPIGSGDIFSAVYAHFWTEKQSDPFVAADCALKATAHYCNWSVLPIPKAFDEEIASIAVPLEFQKDISGIVKKKIYLAGPFFTIAQRWLIEEIRRELINQGLQVFSPLHDVGHGAAQDVAKEDVKGLEDSDIVFAIIDGLDAGTLFEVGYSVSKCIPVIGLVQNEKFEDLKMLEGTNCIIENDLVTAIYKTAWMAREI